MTNPVDEGPPRKSIRSFVLRQGRLTPGQEKALAAHFDRYGIEVGRPIALHECFPEPAPLVLEIGFGMGESLLAMAEADPGRNYIGADVHKPGVGHLLAGIAARDLTNLRVYHGDSLDLLNTQLSPGSLDVVQVFFPDPWHKKKHHKRRLISEAFLDLLASRLKPGGLLHVATDWLPYAEEIQARILQHAEFMPTEPPSRVETKYERRGLRLGHTVSDIAALRQ